jgi:hypothetical protein
MTKLEELKAAFDATLIDYKVAVAALGTGYALETVVYEAAYAAKVAAAAAHEAARAAHYAELKKTQERTLMTKLEELKAACKATLTDYEAAYIAVEAEYDSCGSAYALQVANDAEATAAYALACAARKLLTELN